METPIVIEIESREDPTKWTRIDYWEEYRISSSVFTDCDNFNLSVCPMASEYFRAGNQRIRIHCTAGGEDYPQLFGITDEKASQAGVEKRTLNITGRDMAAPLVDNDAPMMSLRGLTVTQLAEKLCDPWMPDYIMSIASDNAPNTYKMIGHRGHVKKRYVVAKGRAKEVKTRIKGVIGGYTSPQYRGLKHRFRETSINSPEPIMTVLKRHLQRCACAPWMQADGTLFMGRPQYRGFIHEPSLVFNRIGTGNVLDGNLVISTADRFSHYYVRGQGRGKKTDRGSAVTRHTQVVHDPGPAFWRNGKNFYYKAKNLAVGKEIQSATILRRIARETVIRQALAGFQYSLVVDGHVSGNGAIWAPDCCVDVQDDVHKIRGVYYVAGRDFWRSKDTGQKTVLHLIPAGLWLALDHDTMSDKEFDEFAWKKIWW